jgi:hypothetical protein
MPADRELLHQVAEAFTDCFPVGLNDLPVTGKLPQRGVEDIYFDSHSLSLSSLARRSTHAFALFQRSHFAELLT